MSRKKGRMDSHSPSLINEEKFYLAPKSLRAMTILWTSFVPS